MPLDFESLVPKGQQPAQPQQQQQPAGLDFQSLVPQGAPAAPAAEEPGVRGEVPEDYNPYAAAVGGGGAAVGKAVGTAVKNIPSSAAHFAQDVAQPFLHPIDTAVGLKNLGKGILQKTGVVSGKDAEKYADAVGTFLKDRYGSMENIQHTFQTDPIGMAADISMLLSGGGSAAARLPGMAGEIGEAAATVGRTVDPINAVTAAGRGAATVGRHVAGDYLTHTGDRPLEKAVEAGKLGGEKAEAFQSSLRNPKEQFEKTVKETRAAVQAIGQEAGKAYRSGMVDIKADKTVLDFRHIDEEIARTEEIGRFKTFKKDTPQVDEIRNKMVSKIQEFKDAGYLHGAHEYHTPEGFDALKQSLRNMAEETERGSPASKVAWGIYNSVRDTIVKQAPAYSKVMEGYAQGKKLIRELESEVTGKPGANITPTLRKLQSVMRDNVHTAYGQREALVQILVDNGAKNLLSRLAGQALSTWTPRGFGRGIASSDLVASLGAAALGHPWVLANLLVTLPMMSPRIMGEAAYYAGKSTPYIPGRKTGDAAFQAGRLNEQENNPHNMRRPAAPPAVRYDQNGNPVDASQGGGGANHSFLEQLNPISSAHAMEDTRRIVPEGPGRGGSGGGGSRGKSITAEDAAYRVGVADARNKRGVLGTSEAAGSTILDKGSPEVQAAYRRGIEEGLSKR